MNREKMQKCILQSNLRYRYGFIAIVLVLLPFFWPANSQLFNPFPLPARQAPCVVVSSCLPCNLSTVCLHVRVFLQHLAQPEPTGARSLLKIYRVRPEAKLIRERNQSGHYGRWRHVAYPEAQPQPTRASCREWMEPKYKSQVQGRAISTYSNYSHIYSSYRSAQSFETEAHQQRD